MKATVIKLCFVGIFFMILHPIVAQDKETLPVAKSLPVPKKNLIKLNISSLLFSNVGLQYERVIRKHISVAVDIRFNSKTNILSDSNTATVTVGDATLNGKFDELSVSKRSITPELRWYPGNKGFGRGFYFAPFLRFGYFVYDGIFINDKILSPSRNKINLTGDFYTTSLGLMIGSQWSLGRHFCLDWQIAGPHIGSSKGLIKSSSSTPLSAAEQAYLNDVLNSFRSPLFNISANMNSNNSTIRIVTPWAGFRAGISLGFKF